MMLTGAVLTLTTAATARSRGAEKAAVARRPSRVDPPLQQPHRSARPTVTSLVIVTCGDLGFGVVRNRALRRLHGDAVSGEMFASFSI